jgi:hypothetical protein
MTDPREDARVRQRAYAIWDGEGRPEGRATDHWLQAERDVAAEPVDGPVAADGAAGDRTPGPDETVETISDNPKSSIITLTRAAPDSVETDG